MEFFKFNDLGSELGEVEQLKSEIGWKSPFEGGKFYPEVRVG